MSESSINKVEVADHAAQNKDSKSEFDSKIKLDREKRLNYLLKQTEVFSHFVQNAKTMPRRGRPRKKPSEDKELSFIQTNNDEVNSGALKKIIPEEDTFQFDSSPTFIKNGEMRDYQIRGLNWMISLYKNGINGILADEMGLGKTLQLISLFGYLKHMEKISGPNLVIVPKSTLQNWINECNKWCPSLKVVSLIGNKEQRKAHIRDVIKLKNWDVCVTTYDMCLMHKPVFQNIKWCYLVVDEGHRIKNEKCVLSKILRGFESTNRLLLTGTPLQNNIHELWALLNFLLPDVFNSSDDFDSWFNADSCFDDDSLVERLHTILKPFLLRRVKEEVEKSLKPKKEIKIFVQLTPMQREWYKKIISNNIEIVDGAGYFRKAQLRYLVMQLRKCTNHPYLFEGAEQPPFETDEHLVKNCGKMIFLDKLLTKLKEQGSRVLLYSQFKIMLNILEDYCIWKGYEYCRLDGNTDHVSRYEQLDEFNAENSSKFIFLITTRAGGLGINLASADTVIIYDCDWNPQADLQAIDRAHRIGQTKQVRVFRLITENTIEERMVEIAEMKSSLNRLVIRQGSIHRDELLSIVRYGIDHVFEEKGSVSVNEDIDKILQLSDIKAQKLDEKTNNSNANGIRNLVFDTIAPNTINKKCSFKRFDYNITKEILQKKVFSCRAPEKNLKFKYYDMVCDDEYFDINVDRYLICKLNQLGIDTENVCENLLDELKKEPKFEDHPIVKCCTAQKLEKRCIRLINLIEMELSEQENTKRLDKSTENKNKDIKKRKFCLTESNKVDENHNKKQKRK